MVDAEMQPFFEKKRNPKMQIFRSAYTLWMGVTDKKYTVVLTIVTLSLLFLTECA